MSLKTRFSLLFSLFVFIILMISVTSIYILYEKFRKDVFFERVADKAEKYGDYFFNPAYPNVNLDTLSTRMPAISLFDEKVAVYDSSMRLLYARPDTALPHLSAGIFKRARERSANFLSSGDNESVLYYADNPHNKGYIFSSAYDKYGRQKNDNLKIIMLCTLGGGLLLSGLFAFLYVRQIVKPLGELTKQMQRITESNLSERVVIRKDNNELTRIARNFNDMLDRLENAFEMRKRFVQHASHELRTPLTNMLAQTEAAIEKQLSPEESHAVFLSLREDQQHLIELTNSLLLLSKYEKLPALTDLALIRVDETLYEAIDSIKTLYPECHISVNYTSMPENDNLLSVLGNEVLLMSALQNLVKNACHYSEDRDVSITIDAKPGGMTLTFENIGKQLSEEEEQRLFIPFFRGENSQHKKGYGLGLSIVQRIVNLHKGTISYSALNDRLNRFSVSFPSTMQT